MTSRPDSPSSSGPGYSPEFLRLVEEAERYGLLDEPAVSASLMALGMNPEDKEALLLVDDILAPHRMAEAISPNPFLPSPRPGEVDGPLRCAAVESQEHNHVGLNEAELSQGMIIVGAAGSGKTVTIINLLACIIKAGLNVIFWAFTKKDDLQGLAKLFPGQVNVFGDGTPQNTLDPMGTDVQTHPGVIARLLLHGDDVLPGTADFLADVIYRLYKENGVCAGSDKYPAWAEVYSNILKIKPVDNMTKYYRTVLLAKVRALLETSGEALNYRRGLDLRHTVSTNTVFKQSLEMPPPIRRFDLLSILTWLFNHRRTFSFEELAHMPLIIVCIDDAAEVFDARLEKRGDLPPIFDLVTMARQYRISFICSTQIPELLGRSIWDNHGAVVCFRLPGLESRKKAGEVLG